jgi:hypothetical protein
MQFSGKVEAALIKITAGRKFITEDEMNLVRKIKGIFISYLGYSKLENGNRYMIYDNEKDIELWEVIEKC